MKPYLALYHTSWNASKQPEALGSPEVDLSSVIPSGPRLRCRAFHSDPSLSSKRALCAEAIPDLLVSLTDPMQTTGLPTLARVSIHPIWLGDKVGSSEG